MSSEADAAGAPPRARPAPPSWDPVEDVPTEAGEAARLQRLFRVMSLFILWPAASAAVALLFADEGSHGKGFTGYFVGATIFAVAGYIAAPRLAKALAARENLK